MEKYTKGEYDFRKDLSKGEQGEDDIINFMKNMGFRLVGKNNDNRYDFEMSYGTNNYKYEIKTDIYPRDTGNLAIECFSRGKPSGISVTQADYFVNYFPHTGEIWNIKSKDLIDLINNRLKEHRVVKNAGDPGSNTHVCLINKNKFKNYFRVHKIGKV